MAEINDLSVTDASNTGRFPEDQAPSTLNNGARALEGIIARWHKDINGSVAVAGTDTYTATINADSGLTLYDGFMFCGDFANANTGAATINLTPDGGAALGAKAIVNSDGTALAAGTIAAGAKVDLVYDGTEFQIKGTVGNGNKQEDVITTRGDVIRGSSSAAAERLALGAAGTALMSDGTDAAWTVPDATVIASGSVSAAASLDITDLSSTYRAYVLVYNDLAPATDGANFILQTSTDNGSTFESGATDYEYSGLEASTGGLATQSSNGANAISITATQGNAAGEEGAGIIWIIGPADSGVRTQIISQSRYKDNTASPLSTYIALSGMRDAEEDNDAITVKFNSGNIATMNYTLYGLKAS